MNEADDRRVANGSTVLLATYAESEIGKSILSILAKSIKIAADENPDMWAVVESKRGTIVNLCIDRTNVLQLRERAMDIMVIGDELNQEVLAYLKRKGKEEYKDIDGARLYECSLRVAVDLWDAIEKAHHHAIMRGSQPGHKMRRPYHTRELIDFLNGGEFGFALPQPKHLSRKAESLAVDDAHILTHQKGARRPEENPSLGGIVQTLEQEGLHFSQEVVANYVLALQTKRFAILTGISGTGKTRIAMGVAKYFQSFVSPTPTEMRDEAVEVRVQSEDGGSDGRETGPLDRPVIKDRTRSVVVPVRPDWVDNRGLLGYFNPVTEKYSPTPFLRLLLAAREEEDLAGRVQRDSLPFFVILDEMNLARVEHYFSDFLSALESGEPIPLHEDAMTEHGERTGISVPRDLPVPNNVFFTGTVNVDETTFMFSPKVLDRAFTIELDQVDLVGYTSKAARGQPSKPDLDLSGEVHRLARYRKPTRGDWREFSEVNEGRLHRALVELQAILEKEHRHFGYRVANEIARFVNLAGKQSVNQRRATTVAFDLALIQKVLPKFHGTPQELAKLLDQVFNFAVHGPGRGGSLDDVVHLEDWMVVDGRLRAVSGKSPSSELAHPGQQAAAMGETGDAPDSEELAPAAESEAWPAFPRTAAKVWRMLRRLSQRGFTSFIE